MKQCHNFWFDRDCSTWCTFWGYWLLVFEWTNVFMWEETDILFQEREPCNILLCFCLINRPSCETIRRICCVFGLDCRFTVLLLNFPTVFSTPLCPSSLPTLFLSDLDSWWGKERREVTLWQIVNKPPMLSFQNNKYLILSRIINT